MEQSTSIMRYVAGTAAALLLVMTCGAVSAQSGPYPQPADTDAGGSPSQSSPVQRVEAAEATNDSVNTEGSSGTSAESQAAPAN